MTRPHLNAEELKALVRSVPDFPKPGILFRDITTLLKDGAAFAAVIGELDGRYRGRQIDAIAGIESRGFIFGAALAARLGTGFIPIRKPGKLPWKTERATYQLEYGTDCLEIHQDAVKPGQRVLVVDDLLATGGTAHAAAGLVRQLGGEVHALAFLVELTFLAGREKLTGERVVSILQYAS